MSRQYTVGFANQTAGLITLIAGLPATATGFKVLRGRVNQSSSTTSNMQRVQMVQQASAYITAAVSSVGNLNAIRNDDPTSKFSLKNAATITAGTFGVAATAEGGGSKTVMWEDGFHIFNGWEFIATPYDTLYAQASDTSSLGLFLPAAPAATGNWNATLWFEEV